MPKTSLAYQSAWTNYRRMRKRGLLAIAGSFMLMYLWREFPASLGCVKPFIETVLALIFVATCVVFVTRLQHFKCPRCLDSFFAKSWFDWASPFQKRCLHCGLPKWSSGDDEASKK